MEGQKLDSKRFDDVSSPAKGSVSWILDREYLQSPMRCAIFMAPVLAKGILSCSCVSAAFQSRPKMRFPPKRSCDSFTYSAFQPS